MITIIIPEWVVWVLVGLMTINVLLTIITVILRIEQRRLERKLSLERRP